MLTHKCIYDNAPKHLRVLNKVSSTFKYNLRSDGDMFLEDYSARSKRTLGDRARDMAFKIAAPKIRNILPENIRKHDN